jgi:hypothetical protein
VSPNGAPGDLDGFRNLGAWRRAVCSNGLKISPFPQIYEACEAAYGNAAALLEEAAGATEYREGTAHFRY